MTVRLFRGSFDKRIQGMTMNVGTVPIVDVGELEVKVQEMYREVAEHPEGSFHFELGRGLAERLGYPAMILDEIPAPAVESFAGVGYFFDLAQLVTGESVVDFGSGSRMDVLRGNGGRAVGARDRDRHDTGPAGQGRCTSRPSGSGR